MDSFTIAKSSSNLRRYFFLILLLIAFDSVLPGQMSKFHRGMELLDEKASIQRMDLSDSFEDETALYGRLNRILGRIETGICDELEEAMIFSEIHLGFINPDTVLVIDRDTTIISDILLVNNARLIFRDAEIAFRGEIWSLHNSSVLIENADFNFLQEYIYQCGMIAIDSADIVIRDSRLHSRLKPFI